MNAQAVLCALLVLSHAMEDTIYFPEMNNNAELRELMMDVLQRINARDSSGAQRCLMYDDNRNIIHNLEDQSPLIMDPDIETWRKEEIDKKRRKRSHEQSSHEKLVNQQEAVTIAKNRKPREQFKEDITKDNGPRSTLRSPDTESRSAEKTETKWKHHVQDRPPFEKKLTHQDSAKIGEDKRKPFLKGEITKNNQPAYTLKGQKDLDSPRLPFIGLAPHQDSSNTHNPCVLNLHSLGDSKTLGSTLFPTSKSDDFPHELPIQLSPWNSDTTTTDKCCDRNPYDHIHASTNRQGDNPIQGHKAPHPYLVGHQYSSSARVQDFSRIEEGGDEAVSIFPHHQKMKEDDQMEHVKKLDVDSTNRAKQMDWYKKQYRFYDFFPEYFSRGAPHHREEIRDFDNIYDMLLSVFFNYF